MSLVISKNGKIQSYFHKESTSVGKTLRPNTSKEVNDFEEFDIEGNFLGKKSSNTSQKKALSSYSKVQTGVKKSRTRVLVKDIMNSPVFTFYSDKSIGEAILDMKKFHKRHYPIVEQNVIIGIVSERDLLTAKANGKTSDTIVNDIMTNEVILVREDTDIRIVSKIMIEENISSLPVIDDSDTLIGMITKTDLLKCIMNNMPIDYFI
jgi:acetoin utilization protein AcuB